MIIRGSYESSTDKPIKHTITQIKKSQTLKLSNSQKIPRFSCHPNSVKRPKSEVMNPYIIPVQMRWQRELWVREGEKEQREWVHEGETDQKPLMGASHDSAAVMVPGGNGAKGERVCKGALE